MKKKMAIILGTLGAVVLVVIAVICWKNRYGAKLYSTKYMVDGWLKTEFLEENKVYGAYYFNPECLEDSDEAVEEYYVDQESPKTRTYLIKDKETFLKIFSENTLDIDFEKEMVVLHIFTDAGTMLPYVLKNVSVDDDTVEISLRKKHNYRREGIRPYQRCIVIKMQKLDVDNVKVIVIK